MSATPMVNCGFFSNSPMELKGADADPTLHPLFTLVGTAAESLWVPPGLGIDKVLKCNFAAASDGFTSPSLSRASAQVRTGVVLLFWPGIDPTINTFEEIAWIDDGSFNGAALVWNKDDLSLGFRNFAGTDLGRCSVAKPTAALTYTGLKVPWELHFITDKKTSPATLEIQARRYDPYLGYAPIIETFSVAPSGLGLANTTYLRFGKQGGTGAKAVFYLGHPHAWEGMPLADYGPVGVAMGVARPTSQITNSTSWLGHDSVGDKVDSTTDEWQWLDDATIDDTDYVVYRGTSQSLSQLYGLPSVVPAGAVVLGYTVRSRGYGTLGTARLTTRGRLSTVQDTGVLGVMVATKHVYDSIMCNNMKPGVYPGSGLNWPVSPAGNPPTATTLTGSAADFMGLNQAAGWTLSCDGSTGVVASNTAGATPVYTLTAAGWLGGTPAAGKPYVVGPLFADGPADADLMQIGHSGTAGTVGNDIRVAQEFITWMWQPAIGAQTPVAQVI